jgi:predicted NAD-dependent protein-ADP-ribosyltransferase YbiA (DUF1768 family)
MSFKYEVHCKGLIFALNSAVTQSILKVTTPVRPRSLELKLPNYDEAVWAEQRLSVVAIGSFLKSSQGPGLKELLLATGSLG